MSGSTEKYALAQLIKKLMKIKKSTIQDLGESIHPCFCRDY